MKYIKFFIVCLFFINCKAQTIVNITDYQLIEDSSNKYFKDLDNNYSNFVGTWEYTNSGITYRLILWKTENIKIDMEDDVHFMDILEGKFQIVQNANLPNETIIHDSVKFYPQNGSTSNSILTGFSINNNLCMGTFYDNCANNGTKSIKASCGLQKLSTDTIRFTLKKIGKLLPTETFSVPTDCILTKVN